MKSRTALGILEEAISERDHFRSQLIRRNGNIDRQASSAYNYWDHYIEGAVAIFIAIHPEESRRIKAMVEEH